MRKRLRIKKLSKFFLVRSSVVKNIDRVINHNNWETAKRFVIDYPLSLEDLEVDRKTVKVSHSDRKKFAI